MCAASARPAFVDYSVAGLEGSEAPGVRTRLERSCVVWSIAALVARNSLRPIDRLVQVSIHALLLRGVT